ncbi:MAG TPA: LapA family protein [Actinomycetota bacterium]|jgi:uncharacterized integral membrane protein
MRRGDDLGPEDRDRDLKGGDPLKPPASGISGRQIVIGVLAIVLIAFAIANFEPVEVNFLMFQTDARVVTVIAVAGGLGFVIGYFVGRPSRRDRARLRERDED